MKKIILFTICFIASVYAFAQSEASNWYFGDNAGIQFNANGSITELTNGQLSTDEGCTTISDTNGNLLFYTDGITVWTRNHTIMQNGNDLLGNPSSTQSAIVIPKPNDQNIYYIFTVDDIKNTRDPFNIGLNYSEVDISLDNGLGAVTTKNINLVRECSEKVTAVVKDCLTKSIWVITFASKNGDGDIFDTFHAFEVSNTGVSTSAVTSTFDSLNVEDGRGYLKLSPDGTKLACANVRDGLYLYDFDSSTGIVSNQIEIEIIGVARRPYGVEFSPNSKLLYVHSSNDFFNNSGVTIPSNHVSALTQFDLTATDISNSSITIDNRQLYRGGLQLGPDGRIYRAMSITYPLGSPFLSTINNPNVLGISCNYEHNAISLSRNSRHGLPPFITSFFAEKIDIIGNNSTSTNLKICDGDTFSLKAPESPMASYIWSLNGLPLTELNGTPVTESDFELEISSAGLYKVFIDLNTGDCTETFEGIANITFVPNPVAFDAELTQCDEDGVFGGFTKFNLNQANENLTGGVLSLSTRFYSDKSRNMEILNSNDYNYNADNPNPIYVEVYNTETGCYNTSTLILNLSLQQIEPFLYPICDELNSEDGINTFSLDDITFGIQTANNFIHQIIYYKNFNDALLEENDLETSYTNISSPYKESIYARVENDNACFSIIEVLLEVNKLPNIETDYFTYYCLNALQPISINAAIIDSSSLSDYIYEWNTGETTYAIDINKQGVYNVIVTNKLSSCSKERTVVVEASNIATFNQQKPFDVIDASQNNTITVFASGEGIYEYALIDNNDTIYRDFQTSNTFENVFPGIYTIQVKDIKNDCGTVPIDVSVVGFPKFFTPNNDRSNDTWQVYGISSMFQANSKILIFNRYGKLLKELDPLGEGWNGLFNGEKVPTDDYWFSVTLQDGRVFKSHFTLKH